VSESHLPLIAWPNFSNDNDYKAWMAQAILAYLSIWADSPTEADFKPANPQTIRKLEIALGCELPQALKNYHLNFGVTELAERLNKLDIDDDYGIKSLLDAYPGIVDMELSATDMADVQQMIAFGDYLGNGNMWCFHRQSQAIYFFDHDSAPVLTAMFDDVKDYLDVLMVMNIAHAHTDLDGTHDAIKLYKPLLIERFGKAFIKKWMY
jgi:hypothetical protein